MPSLVPTGTDTFKLQQDDGTRIDRLRSTDRANGDADGEYWRVTAPDGTRYYYGYNRLPGWASGKETTEPCRTPPSPTPSWPTAWTRRPRRSATGAASPRA